MIRVGVLGARGRVGRRILQLLEDEFASQAMVHAQPSRGESLAGLLESDVVIDFSSSAAMADLARHSLQATKKLPAFVVGSTGWQKDEQATLNQLAQKTAVLQAPNFSLGIAVLSQALRGVGPTLSRLGYSVRICETHHIHKKDAPSGTALLLKDAVGTANVPIESLRKGEVLGDHDILFEGPGDWIRFSHSARDRGIFARGAIEAAFAIVNTKSGSHWTGARRILSLDDYLREVTRV